MLWLFLYVKFVLISALVVRFITRRYIGEYDPTLEKLYPFHTLIDGDMAHLDILDTAGQPHVSLHKFNLQTF
jgi:hypothetical protein